MFFYREYDRDDAEIEADWLPNLRHVEQEEGSPVAEEKKTLYAEKDEAEVFQILAKRRPSDVSALRRCFLKQKPLPSLLSTC